jgi:hypothetical protein
MNIETEYLHTSIGQSAGFHYWQSLDSGPEMLDSPPHQGFEQGIGIKSCAENIGPDISASGWCPWTTLWRDTYHKA